MTAARAPKKQSVELARRGALDEFQILDRWHGENQPKIDRHKALAAEIRSWFDASDQPIRAEGTACFVDLSPSKEMRRITNPGSAFEALTKALTLPKLIKSLTITFKLLDRYVPAEEQADYVVKEPTGPRTITVTAKAAGGVKAPRLIA